MRRFRSTMTAVAVVLVGGCSERAAVTTPEVVPEESPRRGTVVQPNFVYVQNADFYLNGKPFKHVGVNAPQLLYQTNDQIRYTLDHLEGAGVRQVRVFLPNDGMAGNNFNPSGIVGRLQFVLDEAIRRDIRITVALTHNYFQDVWASLGNGGKLVAYGDRPFYTRALGNGAFMLDDRWIDWGYAGNGSGLGSYKDLAWAVTSRFKSHPGVFAWDIANEVNGNLGVSASHSAWITGRLVAFYRDMAATIKAADPNHLVTTGIISTGWAGLNDTQRRQLYEDPNIDYIVVHEYNNPPNSAEKDDIWRANNWFNPRKPVVIEEFGIEAARTDFSLVANYYSDMYNNRGVDAILQWGVQFSCPAIGGADWGSGDHVFGPCEQNRLLQYKDLWARWAGALDRRNGGSDFPVKLVQAIWRSNRKYTRRVPVASDGTLQWGSARGWTEEWVPNGLPGSGSIQAYDIVTWPSRRMMESVWRTDTGYWRIINRNPGGEVDWWGSSGWSAPVGIGTLPGSGSYQAQSDFVYPNGSTLMQAIWRGGQGWYRTVPMLNGEPNWGAASAWSGPVALSTLPGSGTVQAQDEIVYTSGSALMQSFWRGDQGWHRTVPMLNGAPNWNAASVWSGPVALSTLPGSGSVQAQANHYTGWPR
ncbi:MAG TPA: hypothetical protein VGR37_00735 [Longimicrobiaceae bacterium]|nr:hypothetical protein [Longimicrobiaceae bacterium]